VDDSEVGGVNILWKNSTQPQNIPAKRFSMESVTIFILYNTEKVYSILAIRKGSFSRWRPRWQLRAKMLCIQSSIQPRKVFWRLTVNSNSTTAHTSNTNPNPG